MRSFAWIVLLGQQGIVNRALGWLGLIHRPLPLLYSATGVYLAMVHIGTIVTILVATLRKETLQDRDQTGELG